MVFNSANLVVHHIAGRLVTPMLPPPLLCVGYTTPVCI